MSHESRPFACELRQGGALPHAQNVAIDICVSAPMSNCKVIPFRRREVKPTMSEMETYQRMTRNWSEPLRQMIFPTLHRIETQAGSPRR